MSDFSLFSLFTAGLACIVPFTSAYTQPVGNSPEGNPIYTPGLHDVVPVGKPYTITWKPTTEGTVTLVLLKGPEQNAVPQYPIVEKTMNIGSYVWVPSDHLEPGETGYGIQLICDSDGQYQYTTQFGISNPHYSGHGGSHSEASSYGAVSSSSAWGTGSSGYAAPTGQYHHNTTIVHPTGWAGHNTTHASPTGHAKPTWHHTQKMTSAAPTSSAPPAPTSAAPSPQATGAAASVTTSLFGLVCAAGIAVFAL